MSNNSFIITDTTESRKPSCRLTGEYPTENRNLSLSPPPLFKKREKPQVSSIPGISPKEPRRYRVTLGDLTLGDQLTIAEAMQLAGISTKGGNKV